MLWGAGGGLIAAWFVLYVVVQKRGWVHLLLLSGLSFILVQVMAYRKTKYQQRVAGK